MANIWIRKLINPPRLYSRRDVLTKSCPVPTEWGVYAWFFEQIPGVTPTDGCKTKHKKTLLYVGISPDKAGKPNSKENLRKRITYHYRGNAEGSTLRRTLGVLLAQQSGFPLRRVGSGKRMTLTHRGEQSLDEWMEKNAFVSWIEHPSPWELERELLDKLSCPLNIQGNNRHPFYDHLKRLRLEAIARARKLPIVHEHNQTRTGKS